MVLATRVQLTSILYWTLRVCGLQQKVSLSVTVCSPLTCSSVSQLAQTTYHALSTPYSFFGLGRTNNYIENLFVGSTKHSDEHFINMEGVVPNSKVVIIPPPDDSGLWKKELYLRPGEWIPLVTLTVVIATVLLAIIVFVLHLNEKVRIGHVSYARADRMCSARTSRKEEKFHII